VKSSHWVARGLFLVGGLLFAAVYVVQAIVAAPDVLRVVGNSLAALGWFGLYLCLAVGFRGWREMFGAVLPDPDVAGGYAGLRRSNRQINGAVPYEVDEVPQLRRFAERRVSRTGRPANLAGTGCVAVLFTGLAMAPPTLLPGLDVAFLIVSVTVAVSSLYGIATTLIKGPDPKAAAFLARTADGSLEQSPP
jgi:hypothetical protein